MFPSEHANSSGHSSLRNLAIEGVSLQSDNLIPSCFNRGDHFATATRKRDEYTSMGLRQFWRQKQSGQIDAKINRFTGGMNIPSGTLALREIGPLRFSHPLKAGAGALPVEAL